METFTSFNQLAGYSPCVQDTCILNASGDIHAEFKRLYEMLPANSPAKRRQLLNLLNQYRALNQTEKVEFDKFLTTGSGSALN